MNPNIGRMNHDEEVRWARLHPKEWLERYRSTPIVYLPLGLCEPHGQISVFGLDLIKAEFLCDQTARLSGGIVAPSLGYHMHESGYHARWLEEQIGEVNPRMTGMPPHVMLHFFLYQLRTFVNAGFQAIIVLTGHAGGNQVDLQRAAQLFMNQFPVRIWVGTDGDLVKGQFRPDHAGQFEISQLMHIDPSLICMERTADEQDPQYGGKFARADSSLDASATLGASINEACIARLGQIVGELVHEAEPLERCRGITYDEIEQIWNALYATKEDWVTAKPRPNQLEVTAHSQWKPYEYPYRHSNNEE
jgi:creatinine amidohydrolase